MGFESDAHTLLPHFSSRGKDMRRFNPKALYAALDVERRSRGVTWKEIAKETGVSISTISRTQHGGRMEVDGVLALVGWLGVPVETFTHETRF